MGSDCEGRYHARVSAISRRHPRFETKERVALKLEGREDVRELWTLDISRGGLFLTTDDPPPLGAKLEVTISTPDGQVALKAEVVHVLPVAVAEQFGRPPGVGVQFMHLQGEAVQALHRYVDGIAESLGYASSDVDASDEVVELVARLLRGYERNDLYEALGLSPLADPEEVQRRGKELQACFAKGGPGLSPAQTVRLERASRLLQKIRSLLEDADRRLDYDLRQGFVFADERLKSSDHEEADRCRAKWHQLYPEKVAEAERHAATALKYEELGELERARTAGSAALHFDPFNYELKAAIMRWEQASSPSPD